MRRPPARSEKTSRERVDAVRQAQARRAAASRWIHERFGEATFEALGLPGGSLIDQGLRDLASRKESIASLAVSLAATRLRREGVPVTDPLPNPEERLYRLLEREERRLAHARYGAVQRQLVSFADACRVARRSRV